MILYDKFKMVRNTHDNFQLYILDFISPCLVIQDLDLHKHLNMQNLEDLRIVCSTLQVYIKDRYKVLFRDLEELEALVNHQYARFNDDVEVTFEIDREGPKMYMVTYKFT